MYNIREINDLGIRVNRGRFIFVEFTLDSEKKSLNNVKNDENNQEYAKVSKRKGPLDWCHSRAGCQLLNGVKFRHDSQAKKADCFDKIFIFN